MGLDISFYEKIEIVGAHPTEWQNEDGSYDECWSETHSTAYSHKIFPFTSRGLPEGVFHFDHTGEKHHWQDAYGGYNRWREKLFSLVGQGSIKDLWMREWESEEVQEAVPFLEILNFSDCEGAYSGEVAADLLKDFRDFQDEASETDEGLEKFQERYSFYSQYRSYMEGLEKVGPSGLVTYG